jgi:hypothetical protein
MPRLDVPRTGPMRLLRRVLAAFVFLAVATAPVAVGLAAADPEPLPRAELAEVQAATAKYHVEQAAIDDGYELLDVCFDSSEGGMGYHYVKGIDAHLDPLAPEALVYELTDHGLKLVAVEYIVPMALSATAPSVLGQDLHEFPSLSLWILHAWIWQPNPDNMFADYNPQVAHCH